METLLTTEQGIIFWKLLFAHLLTDFIFQNKHLIDNRKEKKLGSSWLYIHAIIAGISSYIVLGNWTSFSIPLIIAVTHLLIDSWKSYQKDNLKYFLTDQFLHLIVIFCVWLCIINGWNTFGNQTMNYIRSFKVWVVATSYFIVTLPLGILISKSTNRWSKDFEGSGLPEAGQWIGISERIIALTLILLNQYEALGLLIAAKSILRFAEKGSEKMEKRTEYILIGTLISFALTFIVALMVKALVG